MTTFKPEDILLDQTGKYDGKQARILLVKESTGKSQLLYGTYLLVEGEIWVDFLDQSEVEAQKNFSWLKGRVLFNEVPVKEESSGRP